MVDWSKDMRSAPRDGSLIMVDVYPESINPVAAFWSGGWWKAVAGGWVNHGVRWSRYSAITASPLCGGAGCV